MDDTFNVTPTNIIIMFKYSIVFLQLVWNIYTASLPCPSSCLTCSSSTVCSTCTSQYFLTTVNSTLTCSACGQFCLTCTSSSICTVCISPYVLVNSTCSQCTISNAATCSSTVSASSCNTGYYVSDSYCWNCLLNCATCTSSTDCSACSSGYYLNSSILTCNLCATHCLTCNSTYPAICTKCASSYSLSSSYTCQSITCTLSYCTYCSSTTVCSQCYPYYYWDSTTLTCTSGASVMCQYGAQGAYPNQCNNQCTDFAYSVDVTTTAIRCLPYINVNVNSTVYFQIYLYAYNNLADLREYFGTAHSLVLQTNGQYSYLVIAGDIMSFTSLSSYYRITLIIKYRSSANTLLTLSATTQSTTQTQTILLNSSSSSIIVVKINSVYVHSDNLYITFNSSLHLIQLLVRGKRCASTCYRCLNADLCEMCISPQYVSSYKCVTNCTIYYHLSTNRTCLTTCPALYYPYTVSTNNKYCYLCVSPCKKCISSTKCLSCVTGYYLLAYACISACPTYYYGLSSVCYSCISPCLTCTNATTCLSCSQGYWDSVNSICTSSCPSGYFQNSTALLCQVCASPCLTCRNSSTKCLTCITTSLYYYHSSQYKCVLECPSKYYPYSTNMTCLLCQLPCLTCTSSSTSSCTSCSYNYLINNTCISECGLGYYQNTVTQQCDTCSPSCYTCEIYGQCTSCLSGTCYLQGECLVECPSTQYYTSTSYSAYNTSYMLCTCTYCAYPCLTCTNSTACLSCSQGYLYTINSSCVSVCPSLYFANTSTYTCQLCTDGYSAYCLYCNSTACTRCQTNYLLYNNTCISQCPSLYYKSSQQCIKCVTPCLSCTSFTICTTCILPYIYNSNGVCVIQCGFGKVSVYGSDSLLYCVGCTLPCISCQGQSQTNCTMCQYGYFLYAQNNTCILECSSILPIHTLYNQYATSTCSQCLFPCRTCTTQTSCLSCQIGYLTSTYKCQNCPTKTYASSTGTCIDCPSECANCYSSTYCTACASSYYLYLYTCISNTSVCTVNGYYPIGRVCLQCQSPCATCTLSQSNCLTCANGYIYYEYTCVSECPKGTYLNTTLQECIQCDSKCTSCSVTSTYCLSCQSTYLIVLSLMECVSACPQQTYLVGSTCQPCQYPCQTCSSQSICLTCLSGTLVNTSCLSSCPSGYYSSTSNICIQCTSPCSQCQNSSTTCLQCISAYYLYNNTCLTQCPSLYFEQSYSRQCMECLSICEQCSSQVNCTSCASDLIYYYNTKTSYGLCATSCPTSYYPLYNSTSNITECVGCPSQCLTCTNSTQCILCKLNKSQYGGVCYSQCPQQMYSLSGICQFCSQPCYNCTDTYTCTGCINSSYLLVGNAQCILADICPEGYYLIPNTTECDSTCPQGYYYRNDRTCSEQGCSQDQYKGANYYCYQECPSGYIANSTYDCVECGSEEECEDGLFYTLRGKVIRDQLILELIFSQDPVYLNSGPIVTLAPSFKLSVQTTTTSDSRRLLSQQPQQQYYANGRQLAAVSQVPQIRNITIQLFPTQSFTETALTLTFKHAFLTYQNPIQRPSKTIILNGYDLYPSVPQLNIGILLLACAVVGLYKNPLMTDFAQLIYLLALVDLHYPLNLASALESGKIVYLHGIIGGVEQSQVKGQGKFGYVADLGLLSNSLVNFGVILIGLCVFGVLFIIYQVLKKVAKYNKVRQDPSEGEDSANNQNNLNNLNNLNNRLNNNNNNQNNEAFGNQINSTTSQPSPQSQQKLSINMFQCLRTNFIAPFKMSYLNRLIYFNYLPITLFTFAQLSCLSFSSSQQINTVSCSLAIVTMILIILYPIYMIYSHKYKYVLLSIRKIILAAVLIFSVQNPTYMIGVTAVICIMSAILVGAYATQKWKVQTKFNAAMEIVQAFLLILFAIFAIIGEGTYTKARLSVSWIIVVFVIFGALAYIVFSIFIFILWVFKKFKGIDYIEIWAKEQQKQTEGCSEMGSQKQQQKQTKIQNTTKTITVQKLLASLNTNAQIPINSQSKVEQRRVSEGPLIHNNNLFWTYHQNQDNSDDGKGERIPEMLIRCVNQFSDFDQKQRKEREQQQQMMKQQQNKQNDNQQNYQLPDVSQKTNTDQQIAQSDQSQK